MKKILIILILFGLYSCVPNPLPVIETPSDIDTIDIYYLNDFHGAIEKNGNQHGLSGLANYIETKRADNPNGTILLAGGDMLQGSALSNHYQGRSTLSIMELMGFDAMVVGNHEFDWGLEVVTKAFNDEKIATFPLLGANIFYEGTKTIPSGIDPYTIIERGDIKIGVIGIIGYGLESSIAVQRIEGYTFAYPIPILSDYASYLRSVEGVDYVIVLTHDAGTHNTEIDQLVGMQNVDIILNAHDHRMDVTRMPNGTLSLKSGSSGQAIGHIKIDVKNHQMTGVNLTSHPLFDGNHAAVQRLIDGYKLETDEIFKTPIVTSGEYMSRDNLSIWISKLMRIKTNADIAFHNTGGTRDVILNNEHVTYGKIYQVFPFDNTVKAAYVLGKDIQTLMRNSSLRYDTLIASFLDDSYYLVATNDYVFDQVNNPFVTSERQIYFGYLLRDLMRDELELQNLYYGSYRLYHEILIQPDTSHSQIRP